MNKKTILEILKKVRNRKISVDDAYRELHDLPFKELNFAKIDYHRELRKGAPETILCQGKSYEEIVAIFREMEGKVNILATKASKEIMERILQEFPEAKVDKSCGLIFLGKYPSKKEGRVVVLTGGTADIPIAKEAVLTAKAMGVEVTEIYDVGVAGIHRLVSFKEKIEKGDAIIVVAGMDGVLASVVAGLFAKPIIAVPTSIGYGAHFKGIASLLTMLNCCAPGVVVVNIDNGYGAGYFASLIARKSKK